VEITLPLALLRHAIESFLGREMGDVRMSSCSSACMMAAVLMAMRLSGLFISDSTFVVGVQVVSLAL